MGNLHSIPQLAHSKSVFVKESLTKKLFERHSAAPISTDLPSAIGEIKSGITCFHVLSLFNTSVQSIVL